MSYVRIPTGASDMRSAREACHERRCCGLESALMENEAGHAHHTRKCSVLWCHQVMLMSMFRLRIRFAASVSPDTLHCLSKNHLGPTTNPRVVNLCPLEVCGQNSIAIRQQHPTCPFGHESQLSQIAQNRDVISCVEATLGMTARPALYT